MGLGFFPLLTTNVYSDTFCWDQAWVGVADLESLNRTSNVVRFLYIWVVIGWYVDSVYFVLRLLIYSIEFTPLLVRREVWCFLLPFSSWLHFASNRANCTLRPIRITDNMIWLDLNLFANNACLNEFYWILKWTRIFKQKCWPLCFSLIVSGYLV